MEITKIAEQIQIKIRDIDKIRAEIKQRGQDKAQTASNYDKAIALVLIGLENGLEYVLDNEKVKDPPKSIMDKVARGLCWKEKLAMDQAEANYKSIISNLEAVKAQLNALQSLNKHLDNL